MAYSEGPVIPMDYQYAGSSDSEGCSGGGLQSQ